MSMLSTLCIMGKLDLFFSSEHCFAEFEETTWQNKDILCLDFTFIFPHDFVTDGKLGIFPIPFINFSLIVDPNDPLFEDEIKVTSNFPNTSAINV